MVAVIGISCSVRSCVIGGVPCLVVCPALLVCISRVEIESVAINANALITIVALVAVIVVRAAVEAVADSSIDTSRVGLVVVCGSCCTVVNSRIAVE